MAKIKADFPDKLQFLFEPHRYKVAFGGRGASKSWGFARALIIQGYQKPLRILCAREIQRSIRDSVHKLLGDQIELLGLGAYYEVLETVIRGKNGTEIIFSGLATHTIESIKSYEGCDIVWVEEAQTVCKRSWDILVPTIRKEESEIWVSYNPELETDETHQRFTINPPKDAVVVHINYTDNPWFSSVLDDERLHCLKHDPKAYPNIWEGKCRPAVEGAIYYDEVEKALSDGRIGNVQYDPMLKAHVVFDLGFGDAMSISVVQKVSSEIRIINYIEDTRVDLPTYSTELRGKNYNWGKVWLPHADGFSRGSSGQKSADMIMRALGWDVAGKEEVSSLGIEPGIQATRMTFPRLYINKDKCERLIECLKRYRRRINRETQTATVPLHDEFSHGADNLRYICVNADNMRNEDEFEEIIPGRASRAVSGWAR